MLLVLLVMILLFSVLTSIPMSSCSIYESVGEVLKLTIAAAPRLDVIGKL